jgi:flagella basal body P-ring formation protein FlgA
MARFIGMLCLICGLLVPMAAFSRTVVDIKPEAAVSGKAVALGDLAEISGEDAPLLSRIIIVQSYDASFDLDVSAKTVEDKVRSRYRGPVVFTGAEKTHVSSCTVEVPEEKLKKVFTEEIIRNSPWKEAGRIEVRDVRVSRLPKVLPADSHNIQAKFSSHEKYLGFVSAVLSIGGGLSPQKVTVSGRVSLMADIPVTRAKVAQNRIITENDLVVRTADISSCPSAYTRLEDCVGKRTRVTLREGLPVLPSQVQRKPDVVSGETVVIEAQVNNLTVRDRGIALKDGYQGETIPVKNASSGRKVIGTIIAASLVQVSL